MNPEVTQASISFASPTEIAQVAKAVYLTPMGELVVWVRGDVENFPGTTVRWIRGKPGEIEFVEPKPE